MVSNQSVFLFSLDISWEEGIPLRGIRQQFEENKEIGAVVSSLEEGLKEQLVTGISGSARSVLMALLNEDKKYPLLVVTHNLYQAQKVYEDLLHLLPEKDVFLYPVNDLVATEVGIASPELKAQRIEVLNYWSQHAGGVVVTPLAGIRKLLPPKARWEQTQLPFQMGIDIDVDHYLKRLVELGYERASMVSAPGEFSVRGGIIDIYPLTEELPVRIELFDTEIDSIRTFTIEDQRSQEQLKEISIGPATEIIVNQNEVAEGIEELEAQLASTLQQVKNAALKATLTENIKGEIEQLRQGQLLENMFKYLSFFYESPASLLDYLPEGGLVIFDETTRIQETSDQLETEEAEWITELLGQGQIVRDVQ